MSWVAIGCGVAGFCALVAGVALIYPPAGLIVAGALLIRAYVNLSRII